MCERSPAGCCPRVCRLCPSCAASLWVSDRQQRRAHTWQKGRLELSTEEHMLRAFSPPPHTHQQHAYPTSWLPVLQSHKKAMGQTTERVPIYHSVLYFTQARQQQHHLETTAKKHILRICCNKQGEKKHHNVLQTNCCALFQQFMFLYFFHFLQFVYDLRARASGERSVSFL